MSKPWVAEHEVVDLFRKVREKHHHDRLHMAQIAICFNNSKPFIKNRFNWGKVSKFNNLAKLWCDKSYDFLIVLSCDAWKEVLNIDQQEALADLHLTRCSVDYEPEYYEDKAGKKHIVKDNFGRVKFTKVPKFDDLGNPKWKVLNFDLNVLSTNTKRYGAWCADILDFKEAVNSNAKEDDSDAENGLQVNYG